MHQVRKVFNIDFWSAFPFDSGWGT